MCSDSTWCNKFKLLQMQSNIKDFIMLQIHQANLACSIGGNVAENSGGVHSLKYGTTTNNILGVEVSFNGWNYL